MADNSPVSIDPKNLPDGAKALPGGKTISYMGNWYNAETGKRMTGSDTELAENAPGDITTPPLGIIEELKATLPRAGLILLGAALCIVGIVMLISGTKTAQLATSAIPVLGKVL